MIVICLEGCHGMLVICDNLFTVPLGSGKTELCRQFQKAGFEVLDEGFMNMPSFPGIKPQSLIMESIWVSNWFQRLLQMQKDYQQSSGDSVMKKIFIADRSPYSAVYYAGKNGSLLEPLIRQGIEDLREVNIQICTVLIRVEEELLWSRILDRITREPERVKYNEDSKEWMQVTNSWYSKQEWDYVIENNSSTIPQLMEVLVQRLSSVNGKTNCHIKLIF